MDKDRIKGAAEQAKGAKSESVNLTFVCEATFSSPTRCIHSHQDELRVSSLVPEIEAPASTPRLRPGLLVFGPQLAMTGSTGVMFIEPLLPAFAILSGRNEIG